MDDDRIAVIGLNEAVDLKLDARPVIGGKKDTRGRSAGGQPESACWGSAGSLWFTVHLPAESPPR